MAFRSYSALIQSTITALRMVAGPSVQQYAEDAIGDKLREVYETVRMERWWDHLMRWEAHQLDGTTGKIVGTIANASLGWQDVQYMYFGNNPRPMDQLATTENPYRLTGTTPRFVEPLNVVDDPENNKLFRIWPLSSVTTVDKPIRLRVRVDPPDLFTNPAVIVPFDQWVLINGAAFKYSATDAANAAQTAEHQGAFETRLSQIIRRYDTAVIILDPRKSNPNGVDDWWEDR